MRAKINKKSLGTEIISKHRIKYEKKRRGIIFKNHILAVAYELKNTVTILKKHGEANY